MNRFLLIKQRLNVNNSLHIHMQFLMVIFVFFTFSVSLLCYIQPANACLYTQTFILCHLMHKRIIYHPSCRKFKNISTLTEHFHAGSSNTVCTSCNYGNLVAISHPLIGSRCSHCLTGKKTFVIDRLCAIYALCINISATALLRIYTRKTLQTY